MAAASSRVETTGGSPITRVRSTGVRATAGLEVYGLVLTAFSILLLFSLASFDPRDVALDYKLRSDQVHNLIGPVGAHIGDLLYSTLGMGAFFACSTFFYFGGVLLAGRRPTIRGGTVAAFCLTLVFSCVLAHLLLSAYRPFAHTPGGLVGEWTGEILRTLFATTGTLLIAGSALAASLLALSGMRIAEMARLPYRGYLWVRERLRRENEEVELEVIDGGDTDEGEVSIVTTPEKVITPRPPVERETWNPPSEPKETAPRKPKKAKKTKKAKEPEAPVEAPVDEEPVDIVIAARVTGPPVIEEPVAPQPPKVVEQDSLPLGGNLPYEFPSLSLLDYEPPEHVGINEAALAEAAKQVEAKLADFNVQGKVKKIQPGPVVTTFEFLPAPGVKISKIEGLANDLAMALKAKSVRIVAPIPGKGVVGIEVPAGNRQKVYLKEILASDEFQESRGKLPIVLGKDIIGNPLATDLAAMPHVLVAGSTGSGKSVGINAIICSLVYRMKPKDLRMILVDPKILELSVYDDIPHLLLPVVTEPNKASLALKWAVAEMDRRYRLLASINVRNLSGFNQKIKKYAAGDKAPPEGVAPDELEHLPYIVIILDELADLMMVAGKDVEQSIARLAQKARAAGIHLVVATQRPSTDVVTGLIKANFPTRISFMVTQWQDSKTILDRKGAENLLGRGDMLFLPPGSSALRRVQGCFVSDDEVERVAGHLKKFGPPQYDMDILADDEEIKDLSGEDYDPLFDQAVQIVTETRNPSISYLQRRLKIGYNRSARIIERMEFDGIVSRPDHRGVRKVLAPGPRDGEE